MKSHHSVNRPVQTVSNDQDSRKREEKQQEDQKCHQNRVNISYQSDQLLIPEKKIQSPRKTTRIEQ
jgi:hypothetical protein